MFIGVRKTGFGRLLFSSAFTAIFLVLASTALAAPPTYNLQGTWTSGPLAGGVRQASNGTQTVTQMNMTTGAFSGHSEVDGTHFELAGIESGNSVEFTQSEGSYTAHDKIPALSILPDGNIGGNGSFEAGEFWMEVTSSSTGPSPAEKEAKEKQAKEEAEKTAKRPTGTSVVCNYEFATSENTCVASVGDGGTGTPTTPTGTVTFTTTSGGFSSGASCSLAPTSGSPSVGTCMLVYQTANSSLPSITATYGGDARHSGSIGHTQFLGAGPGETSSEAPAGPEGQYPNEIGLETQVPTTGTTVEATAQGNDPNPLPVPLALPVPGAGLDPTSKVDLALAETLVDEVDVSGAQNAKAVSEMNQSVEVLNQRAEELLKSPSPSQQTEGQQLLKDTTQTTESITKMLKLQSEYAKDALEGSHLAGREDKSIEKLDERAVEALKSTNSADQAKGQKLADEATKQLEALNKLLKQHEEVVKQTANGVKASVASHKRHAKIKVARVKPLGHIVKPNAAAGKLKLKLRLNRAALNKLAGKRSSVTVVLRIVMILPSKNMPGGLPRTFVQRITLKKSPAKRHRPHKGHKKH